MIFLILFKLPYVFFSFFLEIFKVLAFQIFLLYLFWCQNLILISSYNFNLFIWIIWANRASSFLFVLFLLIWIAIIFISLLWDFLLVIDWFRRFSSLLLFSWTIIRTNNRNGTNWALKSLLAYKKKSLIFLYCFEKAIGTFLFFFTISFIWFFY